MNTENKALAPIARFKKNLTSLTERKELALPSGVSEEAFKNAAIVAFQDNPTIATCDDASIFKSLRTLAAAGLVPDGREAALVPFSTRVDGQYVKKCQAMPMVFGLIKMVRRSGEVLDIRAHIVYQNEVDEGRFTYVVGDEERLDHAPILFGDRGPAVAAYAIAKLKDGSLVREFMAAEEIEKVRRASSAQKIYAKGKPPVISDVPIGIWADWEPEMWKKSVIRRICKRLDMSSEDMRRVMVEQDTVALKGVTIVDEQPTLTDRLLAAKDKAADTTVTEDLSARDIHDDVDDADVSPEFVASEVFPGDDKFTEGQAAFEAGELESDNPYSENPEYSNWLGGYQQAAAMKEIK